MERFGPLKLMGVRRLQTAALDTSDLYHVIHRQWDDFRAQISRPRLVPEYGVYMRMADGDLKFDYFCGASAGAVKSGDLVALEIPALYCAVFHHQGHGSEMREFTQMLFGTVLPLAGLEVAPDAPGVPEFIERYGDKFDMATAGGEFEVLIPIKE